VRSFGLVWFGFIPLNITWIIIGHHWSSCKDLPGSEELDEYSFPSSLHFEVSGCEADYTCGCSGKEREYGGNSELHGCNVLFCCFVFSVGGMTDFLVLHTWYATTT